MKITEWAEEDRPREKLLKKGVFSLSDAELLAILISSGSRELSAVDLSRELLKLVNNNLNTLGKLSVEEISSIRGIGLAKAVTIVAAMELGRRRQSAESPLDKQIKMSSDVFDIFQPMLADLSYEEFWAVFLSRANRVIGKMKISQGGVSGTVTDVRLIMKKAVESLSSGIIICHNHPSGNTTPSDADKKITKKIKEAASFFDIQLLDHVIIAGKNYYSFADNNDL